MKHATADAGETSKESAEATLEEAEWTGRAWHPAEAPEPSGRLGSPKADVLAERIESHFADRPGRRLYVQTDKPLYRPGETIWIKTWNLRARDLSGVADNPGLEYRLIGPDGETIEEKRVRERAGHARNDVELDEDAKGGRYEIEVEALEQDQTATHPVRVANFEAPRIKKELEFIRDGYHPGDEVTATLTLKRKTGEPLADESVEVEARIDGELIDVPNVQTNESGGATIQFELPGEIERSEGILSVRVRDAGVAESIVRPIPIVLEHLDLEFYPEGGQLVEGLPSRVYLDADKPNGDPVHVAGRIVDDRGEEVAEFESYKRGMGRFAFTPEADRSYHAELETPEKADETFELPEADSSGCVMRHYDDFGGRLASTRIGVRCTSPQRVVVTAFMRHNMLDAAAIDVPDDGPGVAYLKPDNRAVAQWQGVTRVTVFDDKLVPLAERLVYRRRRQRLEIDVEPHQGAYTPREKVKLQVRTRGPSGLPRPARVAMAVADDKVLSFADDETGHMLPTLLLQPELPGEIEKPNFYFELDERRAGRALDLLMGTRGYRSFEWQMTIKEGKATGHVPVRSTSPGSETQAAMGPRKVDHPKGEKKHEVAKEKRKRRAPRRLGGQAKAGSGASRSVQNDAAMDMLAAGGGGGEDFGRVHGLGRIHTDDDHAVGRGAGGMGVRGRAWGGPTWAKVREFPVPDYSSEREGPRNDFRDTIYWNPDVQTGPDGEATVEFHLSDAVTSFRAVSEGVGAGVAGRDETVFESTLPFSMSAMLPLEVSADDRVEIPVTLINERDEPTEGGLNASFGDLLTLQNEKRAESTFSLKPGRRKSKYFTLDVTGKRGESKVTLEAESADLTDAFERTVHVAPRGFPRSISRSGELEESVEHTVDVSEAYPGTAVGSVELYPNPVATMISGMEGMLREPHGCFEQTSSANYPNVMLLSYIQQSGTPAPEATARSKCYIRKAYDKLLSYEMPDGGFSIFGRSPPSVSLSAYGLLEFEAMDRVWGGVDRAVIDRTAEWLLSRRDGSGGFEQSDPTHGFGLAPKPVSDAYVTYSIAEAGRGDELGAALDAQIERGRNAGDPYILGLAANTLLETDRGAADRAVERLAGMQSASGAWRGADHSITRSRGRDLRVETTSLATMALIEAGGYRSKVREAIRWITSKRESHGTWGGTQATVLALQALTAYAQKVRGEMGPGSVRLVVDGTTAAERSWTAGRVDSIEMELTPHLDRDAHTVKLVRTEGDGPPIPYTIGVDYRTETPATSPKAPVELETELARTDLEMGESVELTVRIENKTDRTLGMTMAHVGLPGGLVTQAWQLKKLRKRDRLAYYETDRRDVILYLKGMKPGATREIPLELKAKFPGDYTGQASRAYLYYNSRHKHWVEPLEVEIER